MKFSIIMPTYKEHEGLSRTLFNLLMQTNGHEIESEIIVVSDGQDDRTKEIVTIAQKKAIELKQNAKIRYFHLSNNTGGGNKPRDLGLQKATGDWVLFIDAGTAVMKDLLNVLSLSIAEHPTLRLITWDMVQQLDPVPFVTNSRLTLDMDRSNGLPYVIPGCAAACRTEDAQAIGWPSVEASDWAFFSRLWKRLFVDENGVEDKAKVEDQVGIVPWVLTAAYAARATRKWREPYTNDTYGLMDWDKGFDESPSLKEIDLSEPLVIPASSLETVDGAAK